jgi:hypothetical protein
MRYLPADYGGRSFALFPATRNATDCRHVSVSGGECENHKFGHKFASFGSSAMLYDYAVVVVGVIRTQTRLALTAAGELLVREYRMHVT